MRGWEGWGVFRSDHPRCENWVSATKLTSILQSVNTRALGDNPRCENWVSATKLTSILQSVNTRALGSSFLFISFYPSPLLSPRPVLHVSRRKRGQGGDRPTDPPKAAGCKTCAKLNKICMSSAVRSDRNG